MLNTNEQAFSTIYLSIGVNTLLAVAKGLGGYFGNSYALIADAIESSSDILSSVIVLFGLKYSSKPADENHPYGHGRAEPLITFIIACFLVTSASFITYTSIINIRTPHDLPESYTLVILGIVIIIKELFYRFTLKKADSIRSSSVKADAWHHRSDALTSLAAFAGISVALLLGKGYETADDWSALVAAAVIYINSYLIFRQALGEVMDENYYDELIGKIREISLRVHGVEDTEKCYVRKSGMKYYVDLHARVEGNLTVRQGHHISHQLKERLKTELPELAGVLIHIEPSESESM